MKIKKTNFRRTRGRTIEEGMCNINWPTDSHPSNVKMHCHKTRLSWNSRCMQICNFTTIWHFGEESVKKAKGRSFLINFKNFKILHVRIRILDFACYIHCSRRISCQARASNFSTYLVAIWQFFAAHASSAQFRPESFPRQIGAYIPCIYLSKLSRHRVGV